MAITTAIIIVDLLLLELTLLLEGQLLLLIWTMILAVYQAWLKQRKASFLGTSVLECKPNVQPMELAYVAAVLEKQRKVQIINDLGKGWSFTS